MSYFSDQLKKHLSLACSIFYGIVLSMCLYSCASTGNPSGGKKDEKPPVMDSLRSVAGRQVKFKPRELVFYFDEFIEVKDATKQVLVSPPLTYIPKIKAKGKRLSFIFDEKEVLKDDATYTINFGDAIVDYHEGNKLSNFTYVFSTGPFLDSLNVAGKIINAQSHKGEGEMIVFLYDKTSDTIVKKEKPFYFAKPDKDGVFSFANIKSDTFRLFAIKDENLNYIYDLENEKIAFADSLIILSDTSISDLILHASLPTPDFRIKSVDSKSYGKIKLNCNSSPENKLPYTLSDDEVIHYPEIAADTFIINYKSDLDSFFVYLPEDTIKVKPKGKADFLKKMKFKKVSTNHSNIMLPSDSLVLRFNYPIENFSADSILLYDTIGLLDNVVYKISNDKKSLIIKYPWVAGENYILELDSAAIYNMYGIPLDSTGHAFTILTAEKSANLIVQISDLDSSQVYILRLYRDKTQITQLIIDESSSFEIAFKSLIPDKYNIEIIEDKNRNGQWDPADFTKKYQPESYVLVKGEKLRENKDTELTISFKKELEPIIEQKGNLKGLDTTNKLQIRQ